MRCSKHQFLNVWFYQGVLRCDVWCNYGDNTYLKYCPWSWNTHEADYFFCNVTRTLQCIFWCLIQFFYPPGILASTYKERTQAQLECPSILERGPRGKQCSVNKCSLHYFFLVLWCLWPNNHKWVVYCSVPQHTENEKSCIPSYCSVVWMDF